MNGPEIPALPTRALFEAIATLQSIQIMSIFKYYVFKSCYVWWIQRQGE